jgi:hypothetical protein
MLEKKEPGLAMLHHTHLHPYTCPVLCARLRLYCRTETLRDVIRISAALTDTTDSAGKFS